MTTKLSSSLLLIEPEILQIRVVESFSQRRLRARFQYKQVWYDLRITDPAVEGHYQDHPLGVDIIRTRPLYLCISLGEPFDGYTYKLVASIIGLN